MGYDLIQTSDLLYPHRTACLMCLRPLGYTVLDLLYCSYECAGVPVPDAAEHPVSCWTADGKPKMGFPTPGAAQRMRQTLGIPGVQVYYCPCHHFWHIGYTQGFQDERQTG
jgi:hypothetical protein